MRRAPHTAVVFPAALAVAVASPFLRSLPGGMALPDLFLLLLFAAVPARRGSLRRAVGWVLLFGLLRAAVSAASPFTAWAGYGLGLAARHLAGRQLSESRFLARLLLGCLAALPLAFLDHLESARLLVPLAPSVSILRVALVGLAWGLLLAPPALRRPSAA